LVAALEQHRRRHHYDFAALLVTDVASQSSLLLLAGRKAILDLVDYPELEAGIFDLRGVVSRKKQVLPYLTHALKALDRKPDRR
jgi:manganese-dependent inorganic pyrophosphatase